MSIITHLRPARLDDCEHIFNAHEYAVRYTCARTYDSTVLAAWLALLSPQSYVDTLQNPDKAYGLWITKAIFKAFSSSTFAKPNWMRCMCIRLCTTKGWARRCCNGRKRWRPLPGWGW